MIRTKGNQGRDAGAASATGSRRACVTQNAEPDEAERPGTQRMPTLALAGVWLVVAALTAVVLLAVGLTLHFV